jgi:serine/threonine protein kinase
MFIRLLLHVNICKHLHDRSGMSDSDSLVMKLAKLDLSRNGTVGLYGTGIPATFLPTREQLFVKFIPCAFCVRPTASLIRRFTDLRQRLVHPTLVPLRSLVLPEDTNPNFIGFVSDYCSGTSLSDLLHRTETAPNWSATQKTIAVIGIAFALDFLHGKGVVHGFLKSSNVLIGASQDPHITDYWISSVVPTDGGAGRTARPVASMSPELFDGFEQTEKVDVYAYGGILYHIVTGMEPVRIELTAKFTRGAPAVFLDLHRKCCDPRPGSRPSFRQIVELFLKDDTYVLPESDLGEITAYKRRMSSFMV